MDNIYTKALKQILPDIGEAVCDWLSKNTKDEEFFKQPQNIKTPDRLLIDHAVGTFWWMDTQRTLKHGNWEVTTPYSKEDCAKVAFLHILGSIGKFIKEKRNKKIDSNWKEVEVWVYNEERAVLGDDGYMALKVIDDIWNEYGLDPLTDDVRSAIQYINGIYQNPTMGGLFHSIYDVNFLALLAFNAKMLDSKGHKLVKVVKKEKETEKKESE
jgi:hypothetical protein